MTYLRFLLILFLLTIFSIAATRPGHAQSGTIYYVSSSGGSDSNTGTSTTTAFETIAKVNALDLQPGDQVLFKCGDTWRGEQLEISWAGTSTNQIIFGSYPSSDCANKPIISGSLPIADWIDQGGSIYQADLSGGGNAGKFPDGINQLFRNGERLMMGRWPNIDALNGGYAFIESHTAGSSQITDNELPSGINWTGAVMHLKNIRWSMIDRRVTGSSGHTLMLNTGFSCRISGWDTCAGWGYFLNNHLSTLDQDGEWYYERDTGINRVYLYSASGPPSNIEGSMVKETSSDPDFNPATIRHGGIMLSDGSETSYIIIDNFEIKNWFNHGIGTPGGMSRDIYHNITVRNVTIKDVDAAGIRLSSWLQNPPNGRQGLRGGHHMTFTDNVIDGANHFGITGYVAQSTFEDNEIKNVALIKNLNKSGMGCGTTSGECTENGDGFRIRAHNILDSGFGNTLRYNRFEKIGYNGIDVFGPTNTLEKNYITQACYSKADCGGVRTFGSNVQNMSIIDNIIVDIPGNVDGCHASRPAFGMGLYIDYYSGNVETHGNSIISTTITGLLYQNSSGQIRNNTVYNASSGTAFAGQINLAGSTRAALDNNIMYGLGDQAWLLVMDELANITASDNNYFFHPYEHTAYADKKIIVGGWSGRRNLAEWQAFSGLDSNSKKHFFTRNAGDPPRSRIFYNNTKTPQVVDLGDRLYLDLDQNPMPGSITLQPYTSKILIDNGPANLTLISISPNIWPADEAAEFTLTVTGVKFTASSIVRWNGADRPTTFVNSGQLQATISAADVSSTGDVSVTVYDNTQTPSTTDAMTLRVVESLSRVYLPIVIK